MAQHRPQDARPEQRLIEDVRRDPVTGIKPEPLNYHLPGTLSRPIGDEHRLVTEAEIIMLAARCHD